MGRMNSSVETNDPILQEIQKLKREASAHKATVSASLEMPDDIARLGKIFIPQNHHTIDLSALENRPQSICNKAIIDERFSDELTLKEDLIEHHDFEVLLPQVWAHLIAWYDFVDILPIMRPVCYDKKIGRHRIDLYLEQNRNRDQFGILTDSVLDDSLTVIH